MKTRELITQLLQARLVATEPTAAKALGDLRRFLVVDGVLQVERLSAMTLAMGCLAGRVPLLLETVRREAGVEQRRPCPCGCLDHHPTAHAATAGSVH